MTMRIPFFLIACLAAALLIFCSPANAQPQNDNAPLGINLSSAVPWETDWMFVNIAHHSLGWFPAGQNPQWGQWYDREELSDLLYLPAGTDGILCIIWDAPAAISGEFVLSWEGDAELRVLSYLSNPTTVSTAAGRMEVLLEDDRFFFVEVLNNSDDNPLRNLDCRRKEHETLDQTFTPEFLNFVRNFKVVRFMDWMQTNNSEVETWDDYTPDGALLQNRVSFEYMFELVNEIQADPWFCVPLMADDAFVQTMAERIIGGVDPWLTIRVELSNEVWNGIFAQHQQAAQRARDLELASSGNDWEDAPAFYGYRSAQIHNIVEETFAPADAPHALCPLIAWQAVNTFFVERDVMPQYRAARSDGASPHSMAIAPYLGGSLGSPNRQATVAAWSLDQLFDQLLNGTAYPDDGNIASTMAFVSDYKSRLDEWGISDLICYEAGQHLVGHGGAENSVELTNLFIAANRDARMREVYTRYLDGWRAAGGSLMTMFASHGRPSKWGSWGMREILSQPASESPKYLACLDFIQNNSADWSTCEFSWSDVSTAVDSEAMLQSEQLHLQHEGDMLNFNLPSAGRVQIVDLLGRQLFNTATKEGELTVSLRAMPAGMLLVVFNNGTDLRTRSFVNRH